MNTRLVMAGLSLAALLSGPVALAAEPGVAADAGVLTPGPPPLERFVKPLALTAAQQAQLKPMFAAAQAQAKSDVQEASSEGKKPDPAQMQATARMREADFRIRIATVLSTDQVTKYEQMTADRTPREQAGEMHSAHGHHEVDTPATAKEE